MTIDVKNLNSEQKPDSNGKAKGYFGLLIALTFLIMMHLQLDFRQLGKDGGFFQKTFINALVWSEGRGGFVRNYERSLEDCEYARRSVANSYNLDLKNSLSRLREACSILPMTYYSDAAFDRMQALDPEYEANYKKYWTLLEQAEQEKADVYSNPQTKDVFEKLSMSVHREYLNAQTWLARMNIFAHLMVVILSLLGLRYRRELGHLASAPLRWATSVGKDGLRAAKDIHNKI